MDAYPRNVIDAYDGLRKAVYDLYCSSHWTSETLTPDEQAKLWEALRVAAGIAHGTSESVTSKKQPKPVPPSCYKCKNYLRLSHIDSDKKYACFRLGFKLSIEKARLSENLCGLDGKWFEPKE